MHNIKDIRNNFDNFELKKEAIKILMEKNPRHTYFANVSMKNKNLMKFFESLKFTKLQILQFIFYFIYPYLSIKNCIYKKL